MKKISRFRKSNFRMSKKSFLIFIVSFFLEKIEKTLHAYKRLHPLTQSRFKSSPFVQQSIVFPKYAWQVDLFLLSWLLLLLLDLDLFEWPRFRFFYICHRCFIPVARSSFKIHLNKQIDRLFVKIKRTDSNKLIILIYNWKWKIIRI